MRPITYVCVLAALLAGCGTGGKAVNESIDALMRDYAGDVPGASVLVIENGKPAVSRSYGYADLEARVAASPHANYRLASVSKQFTATAILLLAQDEKLGLDDPARKWLPSLPASADTITLKHLLTHTSGLIDYEDVMAQDATENEQVHDADVLSLLETQDRSYFAPGADYRYSNSGYALLALIVEKASGQRYAAFLHDRIFAPLGMANTVAYEKGVSTVANRAYGYSLIDGKWQRTDQSSTSAVLGDGGIYSSINDLAKWDAALYDDRLLNAQSRKLASTPWTKTDDPAVEYGYGWRISGDSQWHSGETNRVPQRDRALSEASPDRDRADQSRRSGAVPKSAADRRAFPAVCETVGRVLTRGSWPASRSVTVMSLADEAG